MGAISRSRRRLAVARAERGFVKARTGGLVGRGRVGLGQWERRERRSH